MRMEIPFDPQHARCRYPAFGARMTEVQRLTNTTPMQWAKAIGISNESARAYRRGFDRPTPANRHKLEQFLGHSLVTIDTPEMLETLTFSHYNATVQRDESGDLLFTFRVSAAQLRQFVIDSEKCVGS